MASVATTVTAVPVLDKVVLQDNTLYVLGIDEVLLKKLDVAGTRFRLASLNIPSWLSQLYQVYGHNTVLLLSNRAAETCDETMDDLDEFDLQYDDIILTPTKAASLKKYWLSLTVKPSNIVVVDHKLGNLLEIIKMMTPILIPGGPGVIAPVDLKCYHITRERTVSRLSEQPWSEGSLGNDNSGTLSSQSSCIIL